MTRRQLGIIGASLGLAALGTFLLWLYVQGADARARDATRTVPVLMAASDLAPGTPADRLRTRTAYVPRDVAQDAFTNRGQLGRLTATTRIVPGQLLLPAMFGPDPVPPVRRGNVAVSLTIDDQRRVLALLRPGQAVAVIRLDPTGSTVVVPSALVAAVGTTGVGAAPARRGQDQAPTVVTFDVPPRDARAILDLAATPQAAALALLGPGATLPAGP